MLQYTNNSIMPFVPIACVFTVAVLTKSIVNKITKIYLLNRQESLQPNLRESLLRFSEDISFKVACLVFVIGLLFIRIQRADSGFGRVTFTSNPA